MASPAGQRPGSLSEAPVRQVRHPSECAIHVPSAVEIKPGELMAVMLVPYPSTDTTAHQD